MMEATYNGYTARLNGNTLNVYAPDGHEVMHTFSYNGDRDKDGLVASIKSYLYLCDSRLFEQIFNDDDVDDMDF